MSNEIVKTENQFVANAEALDLQEEIAGLNITFDRIKVPSGGGLAFEVPGDNPDEPDLQKEFKAVIVYHHPIHGVVGVDKESGEIRRCKDCPLNQFGTGENGGKACKNRRRIFILRENEIFPTLLSLPTASVDNFTKYIVNLVGKHKKSNQVVTKFSLKKDTNKNGITFSKVVLSFERDLSPEEIENISKMSEKVKAMAQNIDQSSIEE